MNDLGLINRIKKLAAVAAIACCAVGVSAQNATKLGTVDLKKVFEGYYKTKLADTRLKERAAVAEDERKKMMEDYQKANEDYKKLVESSNDPVISADERERRKRSAESKLIEIKDLEQSITEFTRTTQTALEEQKRRMRDDILRTIQEVVTAKAKAGNFTLVLDSSAVSVSPAPVILYNSGQNDLSESVLAEINKDAPAGALNSATGAN